MELALNHETKCMAGFQQAGFVKQSLHQSFYLLEKSIERLGSLKKLGAPSILVAQEKALIRKQLLFLFNLRAELKK